MRLDFRVKRCTECGRAYEQENKNHKTKVWVYKDWGNIPIARTGKCALCVAKENNWQVYKSGEGVFTIMKKDKIKDDNELWKNKEWLIEQYFVNDLSTEEMGDKAGVTGATIRNWMEKFDIPRFSIEQKTILEKVRKNKKYIDKM